MIQRTILDQTDLPALSFHGLDELWMVNDAPRMPRGSEHKLFSIHVDL